MMAFEPTISGFVVYCAKHCTTTIEWYSYNNSYTIIVLNSGLEQQNYPFPPPCTKYVALLGPWHVRQSILSQCVQKRLKGRKGGRGVVHVMMLNIMV